MFEWYGQFSDVIIDRGWLYFEEGRVKDYQVHGSELQARVAGTETYKVNILLRGERMIDFACTCPYAKDGHPCKHAAAVLFKAEECGDLEQSRLRLFQQENKNKLSVKRLSEEELHLFIWKVLDEFPIMHLLYEDMFYEKLQHTELQAGLEWMDEVLEAYLDDAGLIDLAFDWESADDLIDIFDPFFSQLLGDGEVHQLLEYLIHLLKKLDKKAADDLTEGAYMVFDFIHFYWREMLEISTETQQLHALDQLLNENEGSLHHSIMDDLLKEVEPKLRLVHYEESLGQRDGAHEKIESSNVIDLSWYRSTVHGQPSDEKVIMDGLQAEIETAMEKASTRKEYREIASQLQVFTMFTGGNERLQSIAELLIERYPRRHAMIEELRQVMQEAEE